MRSASELGVPPARGGTSHEYDPLSWHIKVSPRETNAGQWHPPSCLTSVLCTGQRVGPAPSGASVPTSPTLSRRERSRAYLLYLWGCRSDARHCCTVGSRPGCRGHWMAPGTLQASRDVTQMGRLPETPAPGGHPGPHTWPLTRGGW